MFENGLRPASIYTFKHLFNAFCVLGTVLGARAASQDGRASWGCQRAPRRAGGDVLLEFSALVGCT